MSLRALGRRPVIGLAHRPRADYPDWSSIGLLNPWGQTANHRSHTGSATSVDRTSATRSSDRRRLASLAGLGRDSRYSLRAVGHSGGHSTHQVAAPWRSIGGN